MMANGATCAEAVELAKRNPQLGIGCHVVLIDGQPLLDPEKLPSLTELRRFRNSHKNFAGRALTGRIAEGEIFAEASAQIRKLQASGISVSHVDTHKHTHLFPKILRPVLRASRECGVRAVRNPFGPRLPIRSGQLLAMPRLWTRYAEVKILR